MTTMAALGSCKNKCCLLDYCRQLSKCLIKNDIRRSSFVEDKSAPKFGLMFDIDGVIVRGKKVIPKVPEAFKKLVSENGSFRVPTVFVTNAGNGLSADKAIQLTDWLGIPVTEDKVVMAHTPLKNFFEYHDKCVLASGQGPIEEIARQIGFKSVVTVDELRKAFPLLDAVDQKRRTTVVAQENPDFPKIEAVALFGEPIRWETSLQLILDVIMTDGNPSHPQRNVYPHMPVLACNMDLQWMAEANMPRFGHGAFLLCLESLYKKITGNDLMYSALVGKPSEATYQYAHHVILHQAHHLGTLHVKHLYAIGDNINTDIFGANLYNEHLQSIRKESAKNSKFVRQFGDSGVKFAKILDMDPLSGTTACLSMLVKTGVFSNELTGKFLDHSQRDFLGLDRSHREPTHTVENAAEAIEKIFEIEGFR